MFWSLFGSVVPPGGDRFGADLGRDLRRTFGDCPVGVGGDNAFVVSGTFVAPPAFFFELDFFLWDGLGFGEGMGGEGDGFLSICPLSEYRMSTSSEYVGKRFLGLVWVGSW